jgi:hypothetical protein
MLVGGGAWLRVDDGQARAPFEVSDERRAELGIVRHAEFVSGGQQQFHPAPALVLHEVAFEVLADHVRMAAVFRRIRRRTTQHLRKKGRDVRGMVGAHVAKTGASNASCATRS